jgi:hypothetical protein
MTPTKQTAKRDAARGNTPAATVPYKALRAESADLLKRIAKQLAQHAKEQAADPTNWGFPGDLGHVNVELAQVLASLGDRSAVEASGLPAKRAARLARAQPDAGLLAVTEVHFKEQRT